jgi:isopenicillin N synthase-like dioxygenase
MATAIAHLETINFEKLLSQETSELRKLHFACQGDGFFYVDLQGQSTRSLLEDEDSVYEVMRQYFDQPLEVKLKDIRGTHKHGSVNPLTKPPNYLHH